MVTITWHVDGGEGNTWTSEWWIGEVLNSEEYGCEDECEECGETELIRECGVVLDCELAWTFVDGVAKGT